MLPATGRDEHLGMSLQPGEVQANLLPQNTFCTAGQSQTDTRLLSILSKGKIYTAPPQHEQLTWGPLVLDQAESVWGVVLSQAVMFRGSLLSRCPHFTLLSP